MKKETIEEILNDLFILNYFYSSPNSSKINGHKTKNIPPNIQKYLDLRFMDSESSKETIMRIKYGPIEERPKCVVCGKPVRWYGHKSNYLFFETCSHECEVINRKKNIKLAVNEKYGVDNVFQLESTKEKNKKTWINKYGVDNPRKCEAIKEKYVHTCLQRYGLTNGGGTEESIKNALNTIIDKYGNLENYHKHCIEKMHLTLFNKYGNEKYNNIQKNKETCLLHYGVDSFLKSEERKLRNDEFLKKAIHTKRINHTWVLSKAESMVYNILRNYFKKGDIICQYRNEEKYPFNCDFYIKSIDTYIEYNGMWTHGPHEFSGSKEDIDLLNKWKEKEQIDINNDKESFYTSAINTWTISDPNKRFIAKQHNLNYIEFWNIIEVKKYFKKYEENRR